MTFFFVGHGVPPCWRAYFLLCGQKKVAKEKATPGSAPLRGSLRYSSIRPACLAQHLSRGPKGGAWPTIARKNDFYGQPGKKLKNQIRPWTTDVFPGPLGGAEQRRFERNRGEDCLRAQPEFRSPRSNRVAQGTGAAGTDPGSPSSLATFFLAKQEESTPASKAETQAS